jgi:hypothetical protein
VPKYHDVKAYKKQGGKASCILHMTLDGGEYSTLHSNLHPGKETQAGGPQTWPRRGDKGGKIPTSASN